MVFYALDRHFWTPTQDLHPIGLALLRLRARGCQVATRGCKPPGNLRLLHVCYEKRTRFVTAILLDGTLSMASTIGAVKPILENRARMTDRSIEDVLKLITHRESAVPTPAADFVGVPLWKRLLDICCVLFAGA